MRLMNLRIPATMVGLTLLAGILANPASAQNPGYGAPPSGGYGAPPPSGGYGAPPSGGYGTPQPSRVQCKNYTVRDPRSGSTHFKKRCTPLR